MSAASEKEPATYFYGDFLQCNIAHSAARQTKKFYELSRDFIDGMTDNDEDRLAFRGDLVSFLRGNDNIIEPRAFAQRVLPKAQREAFVAACTKAGITDAFTKDVELVRSKLRRQSIRFTSNVTIHASPEVFKECVKIKKDVVDGWTHLSIRGEVEEFK